MRQSRVNLVRAAERLLLAALLALSLSPSAHGRISNNLTADLRLGYGSTKQDQNTQESVDQEYNVGWQKRFLRSLLTRANVRYYNFGLSQTIGANTWQSEFQPSGEMTWAQSWVAAAAQVMRRESKSNDRLTHLINESAGVTVRSQVVNRPWVRLRLLQEKLYNEASRQDRDTRDRLAMLGVGYAGKTTVVTSNYSHKQTLNRSQHVEQTNNLLGAQFSHLQTMMGGRLRTTVSYDFTYKHEQDRNLAFDPIPIEVPVLTGLYASDATPDQGSLDSVSALIDGDLTATTSPRIDIGDNRVNQNIGGDLGFQREVSLLYIYTDRPSGNNVRWDIYGSEDNLLWTAIAGATSQYSPGFSRYEVTFPETATRYIKAVNKGLNEIDSVMVTEFSALLRLDETGVAKRTQQVHLATLNNSLNLSKNWSASANVALRRDGGSSFNQGRDETYYTFGLHNQTNAALSQNARVQIGLIDYEYSRVDVDRTLAANYDLQYRPLETLTFSMSLAHRDNYIADVKSQEMNFATARVRGEIFPRLTITQEFGGGRNTVMLNNTGFDNWNYRAAVNGRIIPGLDAEGSYFHQRTKDQAGNVRNRNQYTADFGLRLTAAIQLRGNVDLTRDNHTRYLNQDYSVSWLLSRKLTTAAAVNLSDYENGNDSRSERYSGQVEYAFSGRTVLTGSYSRSDLTSAGGGKNQSVHVGLRTGL